MLIPSLTFDSRSILTFNLFGVFLYSAAKVETMDVKFSILGPCRHSVEFYPTKEGKQVASAIDTSSASRAFAESHVDGHVDVSVGQGMPGHR